MAVTISASGSIGIPDILELRFSRIPGGGFTATVKGEATAFGATVQRRTAYTPSAATLAAL